VKADGGTNPELPPAVEGVGRVIEVFIRAFGFVGFLVVEPPTALYRALLSSDRGNGSGPETGGPSGEGS